MIVIFLMPFSIINFIIKVSFFEKLTPLNVNACGKSNTLLLFSKNQFFINTFVCPTKIYLILYFFYLI